MLNKLKIEESQVPGLCLDLYKEHGTTMAGLGYDFDCDDFHARVHGTLPYEKLKPDPVLRQLLLSLPQRKIIFTTSDKAHAAIVLKKLGIENCFDGVICFETLNPSTEQTVKDWKVQMPLVPTVQSLLAGEPSVIESAKLDPKRTVFFDDSARNIAAGKADGFHTVVVGSSALVPGANVALDSIHNIKEALPELWVEDGGEHAKAVLRPAAVETTVLA
ncbi:hypothetical protein EJB05_11024, partial [Eragrostis curvula]